jgi:hypothetical protein
MNGPRPIDRARCRSGFASRPGGLALLIGGLILWTFVVGGACFPPAAMAGPVVAVLAAVFWIVPPLLMGPLLAGTPGTVTAGDDAFEIRWVGTTRFIPYAAVDRYAVDAQRLVFWLKGGKVVNVQLITGEGKRTRTADPRSEPITRRIEEGLRGAREARADTHTEAALARGDRTDAIWLQSIDARALPHDDYREAALDRGALVRVASDGRTDPSARAASALLLRKIGMSQEEADALRAAATATVHPEVRVALEAATDSGVEVQAVAAKVRAVNS